MEIEQLVEKYYKVMQGVRHQLHMHPETAFEELETSKTIMKVLDIAKIPYESGIAKTGILATIKGDLPGKTVLLRADMDALNVTEESDVPYKSKIDGKMHACGHDGHVAGLIGAALVLNELKSQIKGTIKFVFQPAEEATGGALPMIKAGIMENPKVDAAFGLHLWGPLEKGIVGYRPGPVMAAPDTFELTIIGKGGHGGLPHETIDPVVVSAQVIMGLQTIRSRKVDPLLPIVISCGMIHGGSAPNIIPQSVVIQGTVRTFDDQMRTYVESEMNKVIQGICMANDAKYEFKYERNYPPLINDASMIEFVESAGRKVVGEDKLYLMPHPMMPAEDFSYYANEVPAAFFFLGISNDKNNLKVHHHPSFGFDDDILKISAAMFVNIAIDYLES